MNSCDLAIKVLLWLLAIIAAAAGVVAWALVWKIWKER